MSLHRFASLILLAFLSLFSVACVPNALLDRSQLGGADPQHDFASTPQLTHIKSQGVLRFSVKGVRLTDPLRRVYELWGKPKIIKNHTYTWTDPKGTFHLRIKVGRQLETRSQKKMLKAELIVRRIDVFSPYQAKFHPKNRPLFTKDKVRSPVWRKKIFGSYGQKKLTHLRERYSFPSKGYHFLVFSELLPLHRKVSVVFSLFLTEEDLSKRRILPI